MFTVTFRDFDVYSTLSFLGNIGFIGKTQRRASALCKACGNFGARYSLLDVMVSCSGAALRLAVGIQGILVGRTDEIRPVTILHAGFVIRAWCRPLCADKIKRVHSQSSPCMWLFHLLAARMLIWDLKVVSNASVEAVEPASMLFFPLVLGSGMLVSSARSSLE